MPPLHLPLHRIGHVVRAEFPTVLRQHELPGEVQQEIAQLVANALGVVVAQRMVQLQDLLDQVGTERLAGLHPVPGAPRPEVPNQGDRSPKRRLVLHLDLETG